MRRRAWTAPPPLYNSQCNTIKGTGKGKGKGKNNEGAAIKEVTAPKENDASESSSEDNGDNKSYHGGNSKVSLVEEGEEKNIRVWSTNQMAGDAEKEIDL